MWGPKKILTISPHTDDMELGAGGTLHKLVGNDTEVYSVIFSVVFENKVIREQEVKDAGKALGIHFDNIIILNYTNRMFHKFRQDILQNLIDLRDEIKPDVVFIPCSTDCHQDHTVIYQEALRAFKAVTLLGYELPWNITESNLRMIVGLEKTDIAAKAKAVLSYSTLSHKPYINKGFIESVAIVHGIKIGMPFGEAFEVIRWVT